MELQPGIYVNANLCLVRQLGAGGMGSVWLADHTSLRTRVAVKFISAELVASDPTVVERFNREATLCAQIKSPHVVQTFDHGLMTDGRPFIVMELLEGESLQDRLQRVGRLSFAETRSVLVQTARALGKAHRLGVVHRDIKPDNLFLTPDDEEPFLLKVLDFGIAKQTGLPQAARMTSTGSMVGTPEYMSPEQVLSGNTVDLRSDLWALAVVAYHCLVGVVPFQGETLGSLCVAIAHGRFRLPSELCPELPPSVDRWFERALATDRERRHHSAKELAQTFAAALTPNEVLDEFTTSEGLTVSPLANQSGRWNKAYAQTETADPTAMPAGASTRSTETGSPRRLLAILGFSGVLLAISSAYFFSSADPAPTAGGSAPSGTSTTTPPPASSDVRAAESAAGPHPSASPSAAPTTKPQSDEQPTAPSASATPPSPKVSTPSVGARTTADRPQSAPPPPRPQRPTQTDRGF